MTPIKIDFGNVSTDGPSARGIFTVAATEDGVSVDGKLIEASFFEVTDDTCAGDVLDRNDTCTVAVRFFPRRVISAAAANVQIGARLVSVFGEGVEPGSVSASVTNLDFGSVEPGARVTKEIQVSAPGQLQFGLSAFSLSDDCGFDATCEVTFAPSDLGAFVDSIQFGSDESPSTVSIGGYADI